MCPESTGTREGRSLSGHSGGIPTPLLRSSDSSVTLKGPSVLHFDSLTGEFIQSLEVITVYRCYRRRFGV